jgi:hypothetical protein
MTPKEYREAIACLGLSARWNWSQILLYRAINIWVATDVRVRHGDIGRHSTDPLKDCSVVRFVTRLNRRHFTDRLCDQLCHANTGCKPNVGGFPFLAALEVSKLNNVVHVISEEVSRGSPAGKRSRHVIGRMQGRCSAMVSLGAARTVNFGHKPPSAAVPFYSPAERDVPNSTPLTDSIA